MDASSAFTTYDFVIFGIFIIFVVRGLWVGFVGQISAFVALYLGYFIASQYHTELFPFMEQWLSNPKVLFLTSYALIFIATYLVVMFMGKALKYVVEMTVQTSFDKFLGGILGVGKALIVITTMHLVLGAIIAPENNMLRGCASCSIVGDMSEVARKLIKDPEAREAMMAKKPAISLDKIKDYLEPITPSSN